MPYSCTDCQGDIIEPWSGDHTEEPHTCENCNLPVCWDCKASDVYGNSFCGTCAVLDSFVGGLDSIEQA